MSISSFLENTSPESRQRRRYRTLGRIVRIDGLGTVGLARIDNISDGGAMLRIDEALPQESPVRISFDCTHSIQARVVWSSEGRMGVRFLERIDCCSLIKKVVDGLWSGSVRALRLPANKRARVKSKGIRFPTTVSDISQKGMKICPGGRLASGTSVEVTLEQGQRLSATVRWSDANSAGVELRGKMTAADVANARA